MVKRSEASAFQLEVNIDNQSRSNIFPIRTKHVLISRQPNCEDPGCYIPKQCRMFRRIISLENTHHHRQTRHKHIYNTYTNHISFKSMSSKKYKLHLMISQDLHVRKSSKTTTVVLIPAILDPCPKYGIDPRAVKHFFNCRESTTKQTHYLIEMNYEREELRGVQKREIETM